MAYTVVSRFKETRHDGHIYEVDDVYPADGKKATKARLEELSTTKNKYKKVFIEEVLKEEEPSNNEE